MNLEVARAVADAVLMEGYALYPYRANAPKNRYRWTFGVLAPRAWSEAGGCEPWWLEAQLLVAGRPSRIAGQLRFLQIERRRVEDAHAREVEALRLDGRLAVSWEEGLTRTIDFDVAAGDLAFALDGARAVEAHEAGRVIRERQPVCGRIELRREPIAASRPLERIRIRVENTTACSDLGAPRERALLGALASTHLLVGVTDGELLSAIDPPEWAREAAAACKSTRTYPVLAGPPSTRDVMLCAPFILYDHPQLAPESAGDLCDATEIDELLTLRTRMMTDDEKRHARATDPRAAEIVDRSDALPPEWLARMHGAARDLHAGEMVPARAEEPHECDFTAGGKVRLRPSRVRRTDAQDVLFAGRIATIAEIRHDVDGTVFLAVTIDDDPAAELHGWYGRYHYYRPDEVEPL